MTHKKSIPIIISAALLIGCGVNKPYGNYTTEYGVYISDTYEELPEDVECDALVIDAQYYSRDQISKLKENSGMVLSYINIGSIEDFRDYFNDYSSLILGPYENWDEEYWIDVSDGAWQEFILGDLAVQIKDKGVDGFFVDNADVYYYYPSDSTFDGITTILQGLKSEGMYVVVNGGDSYVTDYLNAGDSLDDILDGVNQESVFTSINWDENTFTENDSETQAYYLDYLSSVAEQGKDVYLIEYTADEQLTQDIYKEAHGLGYKVYISDSLELD